MSLKVDLKPGTRVSVWISQRDDVIEGDTGTVIRVKRGSSINDATYVDVILDTGVRMGHYHSGTFKPLLGENNAKV